MKKQTRLCFLTSAVLLVLFVVWTLLLGFVDVQAIGPEGSSVGFATLNGAFHQLTGVHMSFYELTDLLSIIPLGLVGGFGLLGLWQLIQRKSLLKVDFSLWMLGCFYVLVMAAFVLFEILAVNYRPILIEGVLEASYPSSTTMLVLCVLPTAAMQFHARIHNSVFKRLVVTACLALMVLMLGGRLLSGVHWLSDIIGGALLSGGLVALYTGLVSLK